MKEVLAKRRGEQTQLSLVQIIQLTPDPPLPLGPPAQHDNQHLTRQKGTVSSFATVRFSPFVPKGFTEDSPGSPRESRSLMSHQEDLPQDSVQFRER